jgi:hypothetical protein
MTGYMVACAAAVLLAGGLALTWRLIGTTEGQHRSFAAPLPARHVPAVRCYLLPPSALAELCSADALLSRASVTLAVTR